MMELDINGGTVIIEDNGSMQASQNILKEFKDKAIKPDGKTNDFDYVPTNIKLCEK